ncbi:elongation of very long chain fatty acids protein 1 [Trichonephila clavata]|uniref:Elongation of very long chain fatty acids protein n=1 Tax=Trichonephila clavata TaxID=2740835 RepID=A0A8X6F600_TRICU|nr:elongation of very long chain fatty acids protein 1 [Trichonephila clavata]
MSMEILNSIQDFLFNPNIKEKSMVKNQYVFLAIISSYVLFTKWLGPRFMKNRKPFQLKELMIGYNFILSTVNCYIAINYTRVIKSYWKDRCGFKGSPAYDRYMKEEALLFWVMYLVKYVELLDTVIFVFRKKYQQISFLHVFHHAVVVSVFFTALHHDYHIGFEFFLIGCINGFIHVIMYLYYALAALGPHMQKYLWWKKYLTVMQIIQFIILITYMGTDILTGCDYKLH